MVASTLRGEFKIVLNVETLLVFLWTAALVCIAHYAFPEFLNQRPTPIQNITVGSSKAFIKDLRLDNPHLSTWQQTVPAPIMNVAAVCIPALVLALGYAVWRVPGDFRAFVHGYSYTCGINIFVTNFIKCYTGVLRPYFYSECAFDVTNGVCASIPADARKAFPSGHASMAFATFGFSALYLLGKAELTTPTFVRFLGCNIQTNGAKAFGASLPLLLAVFVASSRVRDNSHSTADVAVGSMIGIMSALLFYHLQYPGIYERGSSKPRVSPEILSNAGAADQELDHTSTRKLTTDA